MIGPKLYRLPGKIFGSGLFKKTVKLSLISVSANFLGFLVPVLVAYKFGISKDTDHFFFSYGLITFGSTFFTAALRSSIVPFLTEKIANRKNFDSFVSTLFYYSFYYISLLCVVLLVIFFSIYFITGNNLFLYLGISVPILFFTVQNAIGYGILNSLQQFNIAETSPFSRAIVIYLCIFLLDGTLGISAVILGYNLGEMAKFFHLYYILKRKNNIRLSRSLVDINEIKPFIKEGSYQAISTTIISASPVIDRVVASFLAIGALSMLDYGYRLFMVFNVLFSSFFVIILSKWSADVVNKRFSFKKYNFTIANMFILTSVLLLVIYLFRIPIVNVLFPKISPDDRLIIGIVLVLNMAGFIFHAANQVTIRATIAFKSTSVLIRVSVVKFIINVVLDIVLAIKFGVIGIAMATIFVNLSGFVLNYYLFWSQQKKTTLAIA